MRLPKNFAPLALASFLLLLFSLACGNSNSTATSSNPTPSATPSASPSFAPPTTPDNYSAYLLSAVGRNNFIQNFGKVTVDTASNNGVGILQVQPGTATATPFTLLFCPYPTNYQNIPFQYQNCSAVTTFTSTAQAQTVNFTMPKGTYSGAFLLIGNGVEFASAGMSTSTAGTGLQSAILPAASVSGGIGTTAGPDTGSGSVSTNSTTLQVNVVGAMPNHPYNIQLCELNANCKSVGTLTSNGSGNIAGSLPTGDFPLFVGVVTLSDNSGVEFISAFRSQ